MVNLKDLNIYLKYFNDFAFGSKPFCIEIEQTSFYVRPRKYDIYVLVETFEEKSYYPTLSNTDVFPVVVDLGAHIGDFSIWSSLFLGAKKVLAVEILKEHIDLLKKNITLNGLEKIINIENKAIYSRNTQVELLTKKINTGSTRLRSKVKTKQKTSTKREKSESKNIAEKIDTVTLEELLSKNGITKVDLMKVDIEGAEKHIITPENKDIFGDQVKHILMEVHKQKNFDIYFVDNYFKNLGFETNFFRQPLRRHFIFEAAKV